MQDGDRSYILSGCITSVIPSWGAGVPLSRLKCLGKERQKKKYLKLLKAVRMESLSNESFKLGQKIR